jgi:hypothetical protein
MKTYAKSTLCALLAAVVMGGVLVGCDREIAKTEKTTTSSDGTTTHKETVVKEKPDGSITKEETKSKTSNP